MAGTLCGSFEENETLLERAVSTFNSAINAYPKRLHERADTLPDASHRGWDKLAADLGVKLDNVEPVAANDFKLIPLLNAVADRHIDAAHARPAPPEVIPPTPVMSEEQAGEMEGECTTDA